MNPNCRISKVKFKSGGEMIIPPINKRDNTDSMKNLLDALPLHDRHIASVLITIDEEGYFTWSHYFPGSNKSPIPKSLFFDRCKRIMDTLDLRELTNP